MRRIHIRDLNFFSERFPERPNPYFEWVWDRTLQDNDVTVFTDQFLHEALRNKSRVKVGVLFEPPAISPEVYAFARTHEEAFDYICTFDESLIASVGSKFVPYIYGTSWIHTGTWGVYPKTRHASMIMSSKKITPGQRLRHEVAGRYGSHFSLFGRGIRPIENKIDGLKDYRYSIAMENCRVNAYFTEKVMDCFLTGTIPIYYGCPKIMKFFNPVGVYTFENLDELDGILKGLSEEDYRSRLSAVWENFAKAVEYFWFEKSLWKSCLSRVV
ncbi:MAG: hypothetical protein GF334_02965 [Candidatus Altiarchaeales archaeon]|nr:hypothetical protein [Candidatus Altiarchaeales archaeon]